MTAHIANDGSRAAAFFLIQFVPNVFAKQGKQIILRNRADFQRVIALCKGTVSGKKEDAPPELHQLRKGRTSIAGIVVDDEDAIFIPAKFPQHAEFSVKIRRSCFTCVLLDGVDMYGIVIADCLFNRAEIIKVQHRIQPVTLPDAMADKGAFTNSAHPNDKAASDHAACKPLLYPLRLCFPAKEQA